MYGAGVGGMRGRNWDTRALPLAEMCECARGTFCPRFVHRCGKLGLSSWGRGGGGGGSGLGKGVWWGCASESGGGGGEGLAIGIDRRMKGAGGSGPAMCDQYRVRRFDREVECVPETFAHSS